MGALLEGAFGEALVNGGWGHEADAGKAMAAVVPREGALAVGTGLFHAAEAGATVGTILQGLALGFRERVVARDMGPAGIWRP